MCPRDSCRLSLSVLRCRRFLTHFDASACSPIFASLSSAPRPYTVRLTSFAFWRIFFFFFFYNHNFLNIIPLGVIAAAEWFVFKTNLSVSLLEFIEFRASAVSPSSRLSSTRSTSETLETRASKIETTVVVVIQSLCGTCVVCVWERE